MSSPYDCGGSAPKFIPPTDADKLAMLKLVCEQQEARIKELEEKEEEAFISGYQYGWTDYVAGDNSSADAHIEWKSDE